MRLKNTHDNADIVLEVPTDELLAIPNATYSKGRSKKLQRTIEEPHFPDVNYDKLFVKTALIRSSSFSERTLPTVSNSEDAFNLIRHIGFYDQEHLVVLAFDHRSRVRAIHEVAIGSQTSIGFQAKDAMKVAFLTSSPALIVAHNHPSGSHDPSAEDLKFTRHLQESLSCIDITLMDSLIITDRGYASMADKGFFD